MLKVQFLILFTINILSVKAQVNIADCYIKETFELCPNNVKNELIKNIKFCNNNPNTGIFPININSNSFTLSFEINNGVYKHLGLNLFENKDYNMCDAFGTRTDLYNYIENVTLFSLLVPSKKFNQYCIDNKLSFTLNKKILQPKDLQSIVIKSLQNKFVSYGLSNINSHIVMYGLTADSLLLNFSFPSILEIVLGRDKKDLDSLLNIKMASIKLNNKQLVETLNSFSISDTFNIYRLRNDIYIKKGIAFEGFSNYTFYKKNSSGYYPLFDSINPVESFQNLLLLQRNTSRNLCLMHMLYGGIIKNINLTLSDYNIFKNNYDIFSGIEKHENDTISAVVILKNRIFQTSNMLVIKIADSDVFSNKTIFARFYGNIRSDNFYNFYNDINTEKKSKFKIEE